MLTHTVRIRVGVVLLALACLLVFAIPACAEHRIVKAFDAGDVQSATAISLKFPDGLVSLPNGSLVVSDCQNHRVLELGSEAGLRVLIDSNAPIGSTGKPLQCPAGLAVFADGSIAVSDSENHRILKRKPDGQISVLFDATTSRSMIAERLSRPKELGLQLDGSLAIAVWCPHRIFSLPISRGWSFFDQLANFVRGTSILIDTEDTIQTTGRPFGIPGGSVLLGRGALAVADYSNDRVLTRSLDGVIEVLIDKQDPVKTTGKPLKGPEGLVVRRDGTLVIADSGNNRILALSPKGKISVLVDTDGPATSTGQPLKNPTWLAVLPNDSIAISDRDNRRIIVWYDSKTQSLRETAADRVFQSLASQTPQHLQPVLREIVKSRHGLPAIDGVADSNVKAVMWNLHYLVERHGIYRLPQDLLDPIATAKAGPTPKWLADRKQKQARVSN